MGHAPARNLDRGLSEIVLEDRDDGADRSLSVLCQPILLPSGKLCGVIGKVWAEFNFVRVFTFKIFNFLFFYFGSFLAHF